MHVICWWSLLYIVWCWIMDLIYLLDIVMRYIIMFTLTSYMMNLVSNYCTSMLILYTYTGPPGTLTSIIRCCTHYEALFSLMCNSNQSDIITDVCIFIPLSSAFYLYITYILSFGSRFTRQSTVHDAVHISTCSLYSIYVQCILVVLEMFHSYRGSTFFSRQFTHTEAVDR